MKMLLRTKVMKFCILAPLLAFACVLPRHVSAQEEDMQKVEDAINAKTSAMENEGTAALYVWAAHKSDIEQMLSLTSPITRKKLGDDKLRQVFQEFQAPIFVESKPDLHFCGREPIHDPDGTTGTLFVCRLTTEKWGKLVTIITVLDEGSSYVSQVQFAKDPDKS